MVLLEIGVPCPYMEFNPVSYHTCIILSALYKEKHPNDPVYYVLCEWLCYLDGRSKPKCPRRYTWEEINVKVEILEKNRASEMYQWE